MAGFITPGKSPNKYARFYRNRNNDVIRPIYVAATSTNITSNTGVDVGRQDDILYATVRVNGTTVATPPSGWTADSSVVWAFSGNLLSTFWIKRGASAPALNWTGPTCPEIIIQAIRGADLTNPIDAAGIATGNNSNLTSISTSSITTVTYGALILTQLFIGGNTTITQPSNFNADVLDGTNGGGGQGAANLIQAIAGASGAKTWTLAAANFSANNIVAIRPATNSTGTNFTGTLTGQAITNSIGSITYAFDKTLTGQSISNTAGTIVYQFSSTLTGKASTYSSGSLVYAFDKTLAGQAITNAQATLVYAFDKTLSGQSFAYSSGTLTFSNSINFTGTLTGQAISNSTGSLVYAFDKTLTGQAIVNSAGAITYTFSNTLTGQSISNASGAITYSFSKTLTGQPITNSSGVLTYAFDKSLSGQAIANSSGTVSFSSAVDFTGALTGQSISNALGTIGYAFDKALTGQTSAYSSGNLVYAFDKALTGQAISNSTGTVLFTTGSVDFTATLSGQALGYSSGTIGFTGQAAGGKRKVYVKRKRTIKDFVKEIFDDLANERYDDVPQVFVDRLEADVFESAQPYIKTHTVQEVTDNSIEILKLRLKVQEWLDDAEDEEDILLLMEDLYG